MDLVSVSKTGSFNMKNVIQISSAGSNFQIRTENNFENRKILREKMISHVEDNDKTITFVIPMTDLTKVQDKDMLSDSAYENRHG